MYYFKVVQLVGYVGEHAAYHHGEASLTATIVNLAQRYVGSNNLHLLLPIGQYGTRDQGGKDHASPRYIGTELSPLARTIFHPADDPLLKYLKEDNLSIEPEWYLPVLPMVLVNGAEGIGTGKLHELWQPFDTNTVIGWSTNIPCYNPVDIVSNLHRLMKGEELVPMMPWWRGFKGEIKKVGDHKYDVTGVIKKLDDTTIEVTELPIHKWTSQFKAELESMMGEKGDGVVKVRFVGLCQLRKFNHCSARTTRNTTPQPMSTLSLIWPPKT
jgi:DNA topoisomerase II